MKQTLKGYLQQTKIDLLEQLNEVKTDILLNGETELLKLKLMELESKLDVIKSVIVVCLNRGYY